MIGAWNELTEEQTYAARELASEFYHNVNPRTLPSYMWMKRNSELAASLPHMKFVAFGRVVLDACKALHTQRRAS